jgi:hypothetical protein
MGLPPGRWRFIGAPGFHDENAIIAPAWSPEIQPGGTDSYEIHADGKTVVGPLDGQPPSGVLAALPGWLPDVRDRTLAMIGLPVDPDVQRSGFDQQIEWIAVPLERVVPPVPSSEDLPAVHLMLLADSYYLRVQIESHADGTISVWHSPSSVVINPLEMSKIQLVRGSIFLYVNREGLAWRDGPGSHSYDIVSGDLASPRPRADDRSFRCSLLAEDYGETWLDEPTVPEPSKGMFYLVSRTGEMSQRIGFCKLP